MAYGRSVAVLVALSTVSASASGDVKCPMKMMTAEGIVHALSNAHVFRGPALKKAELVPVHGSFDVGKMQGRGDSDPFNLVCTYEGTDETQTLQVPSTATTCNVADAGAGTVAGCH